MGEWFTNYGNAIFTRLLNIAFLLQLEGNISTVYRSFISALHNCTFNYPLMRVVNINFC